MRTVILAFLCAARQRHRRHQPRRRQPPLRVPGQPVVIEAKPGAGGALGTEAGARSAPDGYHLLMGNNSSHGSNPALYSKLPYDPVNDFAAISMVASMPYVLIVHPSMSASTIDQLIATAKAFCGELLKSMTGINLTHIPYKGSPPGVAAVVAGGVSMMFANLTDIGGQLRAGKVKPLAVTRPLAPRR